MKRYLKLVVFLLLLVIIPVHGLAKECNVKERAKLKRLASNTNISYVPVENNNGITFTVTVTNIYPGLKMKNVRTKQWYEHGNGINDKNIVIMEGLTPGVSYRLDIFSEELNCGDDALASYYITLPSYNAYYKDPLCAGLENYSLCNKWLKHSLTHDEFVKAITKYREELNQTDKVDNKSKKELTPILQFIKDYYIVFIGLGIVGIGYVIYVRRKRDSFGF